MQDLGALRARLLLESQQFSQGMKQAREEMSKTGKSAQTTSKDFGRIQTASLAIGAAVATGLGASVTVAANFEHAMARVKGISGATGADFDALKGKAKELGESTQFSASQAAEGMQYLAMAGFKVNDIVGAMPAVLNLAAAAQVDLGRSADIVSNIMTGFGLKAEDTGHAVDVLVKTMTTANTDLPMLGDAMKYVAPVAASLGLSIEETAAAIAKMSDAGVQGSQAGTSLRAALLSLTNPTGQTEKAMERLGIKVTDANGKMKPLPELIGHIGEKFAGMTEAQKTQTAAQLVGTEAVSGFLSLLSVGEDGLQDYTKELKNAGGTAERVAKTQMDTLKGAFTELQSAAEGLGIKIGDDLLPVFTEVVRKGIDIVRMLSDMDGSNVKAALAFAGTASAIALTISTIGKLGIAVAGLMASMGPAGWLILGISVLGGVVAATALKQKEMNEVILEAVQAMDEQRVSLSKNISEYEKLQEKSQLSTEQLMRFLDINSEISKTADPAVIAKLREEQDKLREKSGLSNDELDRMIQLNGDILKIVPESNTVLTDQGNVLMTNTDNAKAFNAEQLEMIRLELETQRAKAEANMQDYLGKENQLLEEQNEERRKAKKLEAEIGDQRRVVSEMQRELDQKRNELTAFEIQQEETLIWKEQQNLQKLLEQKATHAENILKKEQEIKKVQEQIGKLDEVKRKMVDIEIQQAGINAKRGEEIITIDTEIQKLEAAKQKLHDTTPVAQRNTREYQEAVGAIQGQIDKLNLTKSRIEEIIGKASTMNTELAKDIYKTVTVTNRTIEEKIGGDYKGSYGRPQENYHTGGLTGRGQMPTLHVGGLASQFMSAPLHNEIDVRLLQNEMVLTESQQANLMKMIDAGFSTNNSTIHTADSATPTIILEAGAIQISAKDMMEFNNLVDWMNRMPQIARKHGEKLPNYMQTARG